jgi:hypothetical protein
MKRIATTENGSGDKIANARFIAAAPDMYEALKALRKWVDVYSGGKVESLKRVADAAMAKAEGKP